MYDRTRHAKAILFIFAGIITLLGCVTIWHALSFHVISTDPSAAKVSTLSPFFKINFSQQLSATNIHITTTPTGLTRKASVSGKSLTLPFTGLLTAGKAYTITVDSISSVSGKTIANAVFTFKPVYISSAELSKEQQQALLRQQNAGSSNPSDPIMAHLPYQTTDFILSANTPPSTTTPKVFPLLAVITPSDADMGNEDAAVTQYKQEVLNYITSLGLNPANYDITYKIQTP